MAVLNPNNWHWVDKNTLPWTKEYIKEKFVDLEVSKDETNYKIVELVTITGDSNVSQRKGKPICYFDLNLQFKLELAPKNEEKEEDKVDGTIYIPEFMHDDDEPFIEIKGFTSEQSQSIKSQFIPEFKTILLQYQTDLLKEHSKDLQV